MSVQHHDEFEFWQGEERATVAKNIDFVASRTGERLLAAGHVYVALEPGDMTSYPIMLIWDYKITYEPDMLGESFSKILVASLAMPRIGAGGYEVGDGFLHPDYVAEKWLLPNNTYTAHVLARFLQGVREVVRP